MIVLVDTEAEARLVRQVLDGAAWKLGANAPDGLAAAAVVVIPGHSTALDGSPLAHSATRPHHGLMSYREAAQRLNCSTDTIGRRVAAGLLDKVGRQVTASSVERLAGR